MTFCVNGAIIENMGTLLLTLYSDFKKLMKILVIGTVVLSCIFAYADKQRIADIKAKAHSEQSPVWYLRQ